MSEYTYIGSEASLEGLMIWWGGLVKLESDGWECFAPVPEPLCYYSLEAHSPPWPNYPREFFPIKFVDHHENYEVMITEPHRFIFDGESMRVQPA